MKQINVGIIGMGIMGSKYCEYILNGFVPEMKLTAVTARKEEQRNILKETLPADVTIFSEGTELIDSGLCEAVIIATPHYHHPEMTIYAMEHGIHVLCDKPAGVYAKQVRKMNDAAEKSNVTFGMIFNQRTNGVYRKIHEIIHDNACGELGNIKRINWIVTDWYRTQAYYNSGNWRATWAGEGGGVLINQCPHQLDLFQWFFGLPTKVRAFCHEGKWHDIEVEDDVTAYMEFENGATGVFITSTADAPGTNRLEVTFDCGKLVCENNKLTLWKLNISEKEFRFTAEGGFDQPSYEIIEIPTDEKNASHTEVMSAFAQNILYDTPLIADGKDGILGLILSNAMHLSSWLDKTVELPLDEEFFYQELRKKCNFTI